MTTLMFDLVVRTLASGVSRRAIGKVAPTREVLGVFVKYKSESGT